MVGSALVWVHQTRVVVLVSDKQGSLLGNVQISQKKVLKRWTECRKKLYSP